MASAKRSLAKVERSASGVAVAPSPRPRSRHYRPTKTDSNDTTVQLAQLLSSRICHDLVGPIGIAAASDDLRDADNMIDEDGITLIAESARTAASRLAFFRVAFGFAHGAEGETSSERVASLLSSALANGRLRVECHTRGDLRGESAIPNPVARVVLCLALLAAEGLPRGGVLSVSLSQNQTQVNVAVRATGKGAHLRDSMLDALNAENCADLTPRTVVGYYAGQLAVALNAAVEVVCEPESYVELSLATPWLREPSQQA